MDRVANWPQVLNTKVEEWRTRTLDYGTHDCFQFCADVVLALTGVDHRSKFASYASREEAQSIIDEHGGIVAMVTLALGTDPKPVAAVSRGDLIVADFGDGLAPGVCLGVHCCTVGPRGLVFMEIHPKRTAKFIAAWTV